MPPPTEEEIRALQRQRTDYFHHWRLGRARQYNGQARRDVVAQMKFPIKGAWPGFERRPGRVMHRPARIGQPWEERGPRQTQHLAVAANKRLAVRMENAGFQFVKILGWGGLGVASLFEKTDSTGRKMKVVCKLDLHLHYPCVASEIEMHMRTAGAKHLIQQVVLQNLNKRRKSVVKRTGACASTQASVASTSAAEIRVPRGADDDDFEVLDLGQVIEDIKVDTKQELDADQRVLFIEYMPRGRFDDYIGKTAISKTRFPDKALWQIFDCLFCAVIGLAYPDAFQPVGSNPKTENIPQVSETCVGFPALTTHCRRETIVHFDIDPLNVLVGEFDQTEHNVLPILKIADLGLAQIFNGGLNMNTLDVWLTRQRGKTHIFAPEQFSEEWDYCNSTPQAARCKIAGNYNWWTNLYQIALIMFQIITLHEVEHPPVIEELQLTHPADPSSGPPPSSPSNPPPDPNNPQPPPPPAPKTTTEWTAGGYLLDPRFALIDPELRHLVALCLVADPTRRPSMQLLEATIRRHVRGERPGVGAGAEDDEDRVAQQWAGRIFGGGPPPPEPRGSEGGGGVGGGDGAGDGVGLPPGLRGPGPEVGVRAAVGPEDVARVQEIGRTVGIRRAPRALVRAWAPDFVMDLFTRG